MNKLTAYFFLILFCVSAQSIQAQAIPGLKVNIDVTIDDLGDGNIKLQQKFNAQLWDIYKKTGSDNPSVLKQQTIRAFPKYVVEDFKVDIEEMDREVNLIFKIPGLASQDEKGKWKAALDSKDPDITKLNDHNYLLVDKVSNQSMKINLPEIAENIKIDQDSFGNAFLTYDADVAGSTMSSIIKYLGFGVMAFGLFLLYKNFSKPKTAASQLHRVYPIVDNEAAAEHKKNKIV